MSRSINPYNIFFVPVSVANADGTIDLGAEGLEGYETIEEALNAAECEVDDTGCEIFIYECRPRKRLHRTTVVINDIAPNPEQEGAP